MTGAVAIRDGESGNKRMVYQYHCNGIEVSLQLCSTNVYTNYMRTDDWYRRATAAVECQQNEINFTSEFSPSVAIMCTC